MLSEQDTKGISQKEAQQIREERGADVYKGRRQEEPFVSKAHLTVNMSTERSPQPFPHRQWEASKGL